MSASTGQAVKTVKPQHPTAPVVDLDNINHRLSAGVEPQAILDDLVCQLKEYDQLQMDAVEIIVHLAHHGAHVATHEPGCAMERILLDAKHYRPGLASALAERLAGMPGELPFHLLARHRLVTIPDEWETLPDIRAALLARDPHGRTVSHWLWDEQSLLATRRRAIATAPPDSTEEERATRAWLSANHHAWDLQSILQEIGAGLEVPDHAGLTAMELCVQRIKDEDALLLPDRPICKRVQAWQVSGQMCLDTVSTQGLPSTTGPRL